MDNCVFCDKSQFAERLCGETKDFWIIATLGQITDGGYLLLVPKRHVECVGAMMSEEAGEMEILIYRTTGVLYKEYKHRPVAFEHGIVGQTIKHAHIHMIPQYLELFKTIKKNFPACMTSEYYSFESLAKNYSLIQRPYLLWKDNIQVTDIIWDPPAPLQYLRIIVAEALGRPERANWRNMDPELDKKLWSETVEHMKPYFK
ncbi:MAG: HIT domain-containing protein [bacterium]|nr:HIT domain-containing protein [bacterium]